MINDQLADALRQLLQGKVLCEISAEPLWESLQTPGAKDEIDRWVAPLGLRLETEEVIGVAFLAYTNPTIGIAADHVRAQIRELLLTYRPFFEFMDLVMTANGGSDRLRPGAEIRMFSLLEKISSATDLMEKLNELSTGGVLNTTAGMPAERLKRVFMKLESQGLLIAADPDAGSYIATGKVDLLMAQARYLASHCSIPAEEMGAPSTQQELML